MSDLRNRGWPNSMKLGENIDLDELLLDPVLFVFVLPSFCFFRGWSYFGISEYKIAGILQRLEPAEPLALAKMQLLETRNVESSQHI